jgi:hypothetical protein
MADHMNDGDGPSALAGLRRRDNSLASAPGRRSPRLRVGLTLDGDHTCVVLLHDMRQFVG